MDDARYMQRAIDLAFKGAGRVSPNPLVGCVIVKKGRILAEGYHKKYGSHHAEVNALRALKGSAKGGTLYVTLEPCFHFGHTPPCVDAVLASKVSRVVVAIRDPDPRTAGRSIRKLRQAGIQVDVGCLAKEARHLMRFFLNAQRSNLPYVIVKVAQSEDGMITTQKGKQGWITGAQTKKYVQGLRAQVDGVLVGCGTVKIDDPQLNVRLKTKPQPRRIILDSELKTSFKSRLFKVPGGELVFVCKLKKRHARVLAFRKKGARVLCVPGKSLSLKKSLKALREIGCQSILVEGGASVFQSFYDQKLGDEWLFCVAPFKVGPSGLRALKTKKVLPFKAKQKFKLGKDLIFMCPKKRTPSFQEGAGRVEM